MSEPWPVHALGELVTMASGGTPSKSNENFWGGQIPWISAASLHTERVSDSTRRVTELAVGNGTKLAPAGATLILVRGMSLLEEIRVGRTTRPVAFNQDVKALIPDTESIDAAFLTYVVLNQRPVLLQQVHQAGHGTGVLATDRIKQLQVALPPLEEQRLIAAALGAFDDLVHLNRGLISSLDAVGSAILAQDVPESMMRIDCDAIDAWQLEPLDGVCELIETGRRPKGGVAGIASGVPSIGAESVQGLAVFDFSKVKFVPREFFEGMPRGRLSSSDVLVYKDGGTPGSFTPKVAMVGRGFPFEEACINEHVFRVRAAKPLSEAYIYFWLKTDRMMSEMHRAGTGAAIPGINRTAFGSLPLAVPPEKIAAKLALDLKVIADAALELANEARVLETTRDELLPLLMSGRVRVRDAA